MKLCIIFTFCYFCITVNAQQLTIENNSQQSDSSIQLFKDYLIEKKALNVDSKIALRIDDYHLGMNPMSFEFAGYEMGNSIFRGFSSSINFRLTDNNTGLSYRGIVLENQVFVNTIDFYNYINPEFAQKPIEELYKKALKTYHPQLALDSVVAHFVNNEAGDYIGEFHLEYKTLAREGCIVTDHYSIIPENNYTLIEKSHNCEPVIVFYTSASDEFYIEGKCYGEQFEMFNAFNQLIHKGVLSRYMQEVLFLEK